MSRRLRFVVAMLSLLLGSISIAGDALATDKKDDCTYVTWSLIPKLKSQVSAQVVIGVDNQRYVFLAPRPTLVANTAYPTTIEYEQADGSKGHMFLGTVIGAATFITAKNFTVVLDKGDTYDNKPIEGRYGPCPPL